MVEQDTPTDRVTFNRLSLTEREALVEQIRHRRLRLVRVYEAAVLLKKKVLEEKLQQRIDKKLAQFTRELAALDKKLDKLHQISVVLRAFELEIEGYISGHENDSKRSAGTTSGKSGPGGNESA